jgi:hypothetical protein
MPVKKGIAKSKKMKKIDREKSSYQTLFFGHAGMPPLLWQPRNATATIA